MKRFGKVYFMMFFFSNIFLVILQLGIARRLNIQFQYIPVIVGALLIALFLAIGAMLFKREKGASWLNLILGFIAILPSLFVLRYLFGYTIFRFSFVIYLSIILIAVVYSILVYFATRKAKAEVEALNKMLPQDKEEE